MDVSSDSLGEYPRFNTIEIRQVTIEHDPFVSYEVNTTGNAFGGYKRVLHAVPNNTPILPYAGV
jgi:hypothetical protein